MIANRVQDIYSIKQLWATGLNPENKDYRVQENIIQAVNWIKRAQEVTGDRGISKGYDLLRGKWYPSYPETTGYTIPTLLNCATVMHQDELMALALSASDYLLEQRTDGGGVAHWSSSKRKKTIVFDTGQSIFGWISAYLVSCDENYLTAASKAARWLMTIQDRAGYWQEGQHNNNRKVIDARVAWALLELQKALPQTALQQSAIQCLKWAQDQQLENGYFHHCSLREGDDPITHTLAYTIEGLLESGWILRNNGYILTAQKTADKLISIQREDGSLPASFSTGWQISDKSCCITGLCQMGRIWLRLFELTNEAKYREAAEKAIRFVIRTQPIKTTNANILGGIPGSYPIYGKYERFKFPNWAAKFYIDLLLYWLRLEQSLENTYYQG